MHPGIAPRRDAITYWFRGLPVTTSRILSLNFTSRYSIRIINVVTMTSILTVIQKFFKIRLHTANRPSILDLRMPCFAWRRQSLHD